MANNLQKLRRILPVLAVRTLFAVFSHITPLNAGEMPHADALADTSVSIATVQVPAANPAGMSQASAACATSRSRCPA